MKQALLVAAVLSPFSVAVAQETLEQIHLPEELAITRSIVMQDADELESTANFWFFKRPDQKHITAAAEFEYGLADRWELDAGVPYEFVNPNDGRSANGLGDVEAAVRYGVIPTGKQTFALDLGLGAGIPTGERTHDLGEGRLTLGPSFTASTWLGRVNVEFSGAWRHAVTNGGEAPHNVFEYDVAILYPINRWFLVLEGDGESNRDSTMYYLTPELIWKPTRSLQFLVAVPIGVTRDSADYGVVASVTLELENITHRGADKD